MNIAPEPPTQWLETTQTNQTDKNFNFWEKSNKAKYNEKMRWRNKNEIAKILVKLRERQNKLMSTDV